MPHADLLAALLPPVSYAPSGRIWPPRWPWKAGS